MPVFDSPSALVGRALFVSSTTISTTMKYSYTPAAGFTATQSSNVHTRMPSLNSQPTPPLRPASQYSFSAAQPSPPAPSTPQSASFYSFPGSQQQQPYSPPGYPPQPLRTPTGHAQKPSAGYTPVAFDSPYSPGFTPEQFYGTYVSSRFAPGVAS